MTAINCIIRRLRVVAGLLLIAATALAQPSLAATEGYTAQRKPRVTVLKFDDTNSLARDERYAASVEAMLVTFLKQKSQLVVVERQKLGAVFEEWEFNQTGVTNLEPGAQEMLEKIDTLILGNVTLLRTMARVKVAQPNGDEPDGDEPNGEKGQQFETIEGNKIEIDAKLLSRRDGRIIAAAQRSGPVDCLRSIVERLGVALEQEYLRPYYGKIKFTLTDPENLRIYLTPILLDTALDEEKPPVERSATVIQDRGHDIVEPWTTDPTTYNIENILSGWYSMRLERPGYEGQGTENFLWQARDRYGKLQIWYDPPDGGRRKRLDQVDPEQRRFVVRVDPLTTEVIDGDARGFTFRKKGGSLASQIKRQYVDGDYEHTPTRVVLIGKDEIEINRIEGPVEYAVDETCDLFEERLPNKVDYGRTYVASGQSFDFETFKGGEVVIDDYQGETLPEGRYQMSLWEPLHELHTATVTVRDEDRSKLVRSTLERETGRLVLEPTDASRGHTMILEGTATGHRVEMPLDFSDRIVRAGLPVDHYTALTDVPGLGAWRRDIDILPEESPSPPVYDPESDADPPLRDSSAAKSEEDDEALPPTLRVKTRLCVGGRLSALRSRPNLEVDDAFVDGEIARILNALLRTQPEDEKRDGWLKSFARILLPWAGEPESEGDTAMDTPAAGRSGERSLASVGPDGPDDRAVVVSCTDVAAACRGGGPYMPDDLTVDRTVIVSYTDLVAAGRGDGSGASGDRAVVVPCSDLAAACRTGASGELGSREPGDRAAVVPCTDPDAPPPVPEIEALPSDPELLRALFAQRLKDIDLLVLDDEDMSRLREQPEVAAAVGRYVTSGGALLAFISESGDYSALLGASLVVEAKGKRTARFEIAPGEVPPLALRNSKKKVRVKSKRVLPRFEKSNGGGDWRVLAFTRGQSDPRIIERGPRGQSGYVAIWLDRPASFRGRLGGTVRDVEAARSAVEKRVLARARYLMYRRYDADGDERRRAEEALGQ